MILTTSNLSSCIDEAFVDRADIKRFIGNPGETGRLVILKDCVNVLLRIESLNNRSSLEQESLHIQSIGISLIPKIS